MIEKKHMAQAGIALLLMVIVLTCVVINCTQHIRAEIESSIRASLRDTAQQSLGTLDAIFGERYNMLHSVALEIGKFPDDAKTLVLAMTAWADTYHFKRMGFIRPDGFAYTTDGYQQDLSFREYFKRGISGQDSVSNTLDDHLGKVEDINVFSVPVREPDAGEIIGVLFAVYENSALQELLDIHFLEEQGYSYIFTQSGSIIAASSQAVLHSGDNLLDVIYADTSGDLANQDAFAQTLSRRTSGDFTLHTDQDRYCYVLPIDTAHASEPWFLLVVVPAQVLASRLSAVLTQTQQMALFILLLPLLFLMMLLFLRYKNQQALSHLAYTDPLTQGDNYAAFKQKMRKKHVGCIVSFDLDGFKLINSMFGFSKGSEVLCAVWQTLCAHLQHDELAAHTSSDHFILYLDEREKSRIVCRIQQMSADIRALSLSLNVLHIYPKWGICKLLELDDVQTVCEHANLARRQITDAHNRSMVFYDSVDQSELLETMQLEDRFETALAGHEFKLQYQPKYSPDGNTLCGAEALVRWQRADGTQVYPSRFIPLFESNGMIVRLDQYIFNTVCEQIHSWQQSDLPAIPISINISRSTLCRPDTIDTYIRILSSHGISPALTPLEVTEGTMIENNEILSRLSEFSQKGFSIFVDDFGRGQSALSMLKMPYINCIKLDKSLIDCIGDNKGESLLRQIIHMIQGMGLSITAEGVEQSSQVHFLAGLNCNNIQGYYFSKPMPLFDFESLLHRIGVKAV